MLDPVQSPAIDRGDAASVYSNEPAPNGGFINLGSDGNTDQASPSPSDYVLVLKPHGGEVWPESQCPFRQHHVYSAIVVCDDAMGAPVGDWARSSAFHTSGRN